MSLINALFELEGASYYPDWLSDKEHASILKQVMNLEYNSAIRGITGSDGPNLYCYLARSHKQPIQFIRQLTEKVKETRQGTLHQVTVNKYEDLSKYIIPHKDGNGVQAIIISLGPSHTVLNFYDHPEDTQFIKGTKVYSDEEPTAIASVLMEPKSCLVLTGDSYLRYAHGITPHQKDLLLTPFSQSKESTPELGTQKICNLHLTSHSEGEILERGTRYSVVIWSR